MMLNTMRKPTSFWVGAWVFIVIWGAMILWPSCAQGLEECRTYVYTIEGTSAIVTKCCDNGDCNVTCSGSACELIRIAK